ncbi:MAG: cytidine deaminase [Pedosphaera sp.]|nr:cytidine deaminase [Pedosphaera sp.]MST00108.1 cytidine deaminase [Pedosphaera sp.]
MPKQKRIDARALVAAALTAQRRAVAPYSRFKVGAALLAASGEIITGANVESASYGLSCCAERVALFKALTDGTHAFRAAAVVSPGGVTPCGACRQLLVEYARDAILFIADSGKPGVIRRFRVRDLLPSAFVDLPAARS